MMNADGSGQTNLTNDPANDGHCTWSPDGAKIAFASDRDGNWEVYVMDADGSNQTNIINQLSEKLAPRLGAGTVGNGLNCAALSVVVVGMFPPCRPGQ